MAEQKSSAVISVSPGRFPWAKEFEERYGVDKVQWRALIDAVFPNAKDVDSVILALSYCKARKLDPFKRPVHIVPMWNTDAGRMVNTIWPGIGELRTTAVRTGAYAGRDAAIFGPDVTKKYGDAEITHSEWCEVVIYRMVQGHRVAFHGPRVYWAETYATKSHKDATPNAMWTKRGYGQLEKAAEAGALRAAFPEEIGNEYAAEEMEGKVLEGQFARVAVTEPAAKQAKPAVMDKLAAFGAEGVEEATPAPSTKDAEALDELLGVIAHVRTAKALSVARKMAIPLMGQFDEAWPEGKEQIIAALQEAENKITANSSQKAAVTAGAGMESAGEAPASANSGDKDG